MCILCHFVLVLFLQIVHCITRFIFLRFAVLIAIGGQLWWAKAFFWKPAVVTYYVCICCYLFGKIKFLLLLLLSPLSNSIKDSGIVAS